MTTNVIYNEDCLVTMGRMKDESIDLTVTSPPYDNLRAYNGFTWNSGSVATELYRVTKQGGVVVWVVADGTIKGSETGNSFRQALTFLSVGFNLHDTMIYEKNTCSMPSGKKSNRYTQIFEYMFIFSKGKPKTHNLFRDKPNKWAGGCTWGTPTKRQVDGSRKDCGIGKKKIAPFGVRNNIWRYVCSGGFGQRDKQAYKHPATFPEKLAQDHILSWSNPKDIVYDPFMGSGTTAVVAKRLNRKYIGSEISKEYYDLINNRLDDGPFFRQ